MLKFLDDAINELDTMESVVSSYKIHLNVGQLAMRCLAVIESILSQAVSDDIVYIQGQGRARRVPRLDRPKVSDGRLALALSSRALSGVALRGHGRVRVARRPPGAREHALAVYRGVGRARAHRAPDLVYGDRGQRGGVAGEAVRGYGEWRGAQGGRGPGWDHGLVFAVGQEDHRLLRAVGDARIDLLRPRGLQRWL